MKFFGFKREWNTLKYSIAKYREVRYTQPPADWKSYLLWQKNYLDSLRKYQNLHAGKECFIIGNGPSLNQMDLTKLNGLYSFGMNKIYLIWDRVDLQFSYYVSVNPLVIKQSKNEIENEITCPRFISHIAAQDVIDDGKDIERVYTRSGWEFSSSPLKRMLSESATVTYVALQLAFFMGFQNVYLIGVDHNFQQKGKPNEQQKMEGDDLNHFDKRYFSGQQWQLADLEASEIGYRMAQYYYSKAGRNIYNAGYDSKLEIFPKVDFDFVVRKTRAVN
ncbi:6-hydroxymethylpterin diphosphokinase MptE-like protein [Catalinimonas niigatensis]|uniref:6-hydroxymethylpterin diphosphokinase MptE-like protein n=1 Tax=Catalinimonas niigatensis TaxID=1397264 RepID=UPI0026660110|nr:6-hydroxymethylpterin diphosphokinase MptE-like protein [Catalinimonas niigatensis]WPP52622.1 6-hydroxymethylpterin diphosphokinase MptE-like protein [Catalinimonas niigatensis]